MESPATSVGIPALTYGEEALGRLAPYDVETARNFELPSHSGRLIASLERPRFVPAAEAVHMRDDDHVVGLALDGESRAYPLWIIDYYHVVNDTFGDEPVVVTSCERCQTGTAFRAVLDGKRARFYGSGMYNATLMMQQPVRTGGESTGVWIHYEGVCVSGPDRGKALPFLPTFHACWEEWREAHPETLVLVHPDDPRHRDGRDGHAREEYFARPGMDQVLVQTIHGRLDQRYPENEPVLGIHVDQGTRAYPLREVRASGRVVEDEIGGHPVVVLAGPGGDQFAMACYSRLTGDDILSFTRDGDRFVDRETGTAWSIEGEGVEGPLAGRRLEPVRWSYLRWHAWAYFHPDTDLYRAEPALEPVVDPVDLAPFGPALAGLRRLGRPVTVVDAIVRPRLPHGAGAGLRVEVGDDPLNLYRFDSAAAANDYVAYEGAWSCRPLYVKAERKRSVRAGHLVVESDPRQQYADASQIVRLPDAQIRWSDVVEDPDLVERWSAELDPAEPTGLSFAGLFGSLEASGFEVREVGFLPPGQLRPGAKRGVGATINADLFAVFECEDTAAARAIADASDPALAVGPLVFRSTPPDRFHHVIYEIDHRPEESVNWSRLLESEAFRRAVESYLESLGST